MTDLMPTIVTGFLGIFAGIFIGRRGVTDQAAVEHRQWLRGQRQEAYINLLDAWDAALAALEDVVDVWDDRVEEASRGDGFMEDFVELRVEAANQTLAKPLDRAALMGPREADVGVDAMDSTFDAMSASLNHQSNPDEPFEADWHSWTTLLSQPHRSRRVFMESAKTSLRMMPRPGPRRWDQPWWRPNWNGRGEG
ncbi:hypothetical protein [Streptomyces sp. NPDC050535]|uniref:hypothetical protein n=1 Tax=Streptomyces sp. NPDC050535 TaxID=3365626 RepID=UPI00379E96C0